MRVAVLLLVTLLAAALSSQVRLLQYRTLDLSANPPDCGDVCENFASLLSSNRLFKATYQARLKAAGLNLSYSEFHRHVRFYARSKAKAVEIRVWDRSPADADKIAAAALESLHDLERGLWIFDGETPPGYYRNSINDAARG